MKSRDTHIFTKERHGWYIEPSWCSERLFATESFPGVIYDPACGWGTILHQASTAGYLTAGADIIDRGRHKLGRQLFSIGDFLKRTRPFANTSIVTNPPFDLVQEFAEHALHLKARKVALICLVRRLNAARWLQDLPLEKVLLLTPRPSMPPGAYLKAGKKPGGGTQDFCWLILSPRHKGPPTLDWLRRDP